jgi:hypothetical protein
MRLELIYLTLDCDLHLTSSELEFPCSQTMTLQATQMPCVNICLVANMLLLAPLIQYSIEAIATSLFRVALRTVKVLETPPLLRCRIGIMATNSLS